RVPCLLDGVSLSGARHEGMDDPGAFLAIGFHAMQTQEGPYRRQAAERFVAGEAIAAVDAFSFGGRIDEGNLTAALSVPGGIYFSLDCSFEQPLQRFVACAPEVSGDAGPIQVHVE